MYPLPSSLVVARRRLEHRAVVGYAALEGRRHIVEVDVVVQGGVYAQFLYHVFKGHCGHAALAALQVSPCPRDRSIQSPVRRPRHKEAAVALGELPEYFRRVGRAAYCYIQRGLGAAEAHVRAARKHRRHGVVCAAAVGEFHLKSLVFVVAERVGKVHRRVEHRVRNFVYFKHVAAALTARKRKRYCKCGA